MVNGKVYSWEDITINVPGLEEIAITEISYDFEQEAEHLPQGRRTMRLWDRKQEEYGEGGHGA